MTANNTAATTTGTDSNNPDLASLLGSVLTTPEAQAVINHPDMQQVAADSTFQALMSAVKNHTANLINQLSNTGGQSDAMSPADRNAYFQATGEHISGDSSNTTPTTQAAPDTSNAITTHQEVSKALDDSTLWGKAHAAAERFNPDASQADKDKIAAQLFARSKADRR